jgi:hypothetical protein
VGRATGCVRRGGCATVLYRRDPSHDPDSGQPMSQRLRIVAFGSAGLLIVAGVLCAAVIGRGAGETLALVLIGLGLVLATSLVFLEIGLSEDRERDRAGTERDRAGRRDRAGQADSPTRSDRPPRARGRRDRMRSHRRRIR